MWRQAELLHVHLFINHKTQTSNQIPIKYQTEHVDKKGCISSGRIMYDVLCYQAELLVWMFVKKYL